MATVSIHHAKKHMSRLLERVAAGEEIIIERADKPTARLVPYQDLSLDRVPGLFEGQIKIAEDFDAPLPEEILRAFEDPD